jgi:hypothetical protein
MFGERREGEEKTVNKYITTTTLARQKTPVLKGQSISFQKQSFHLSCPYAFVACI